MITFGSVCSGIEAASVAWNPLGWHAAWLAEIEPFPSAVLAHHYPDVPNLGDMTALADRILAGEVPAPDVFCGGTPCFTAGHMVLTSAGYAPIESIKPGYEVVTHEGRLRKVLRTGFKTAKVGRLSAVGLPDGIVCTAEHPFLSSRCVNQNTKRNNAYAKVESCTEPEWVEAKDLPGRQWCALSQVEPVSHAPISRLFDERTAMYVAGMYLGDGWTRGWAGQKKRAVVLGINEAKYQKLLAVIGQISHAATVERTGVRVCFGDTAFANWLEINFGRLSHEKTLPTWVLGHTHRDALLQGYLDTDGCVAEGKATINSTSKSLAYGVCDLLNVEGWTTSVAKIKTPDFCVIEGRTVNQRDYFQVRANRQNISRKSRVRHGYLMRTVQSWEALGDETVFNIEVEGDHSYVLNGAVVHNCQAFSVAGLRNSLADARGNLSLVFVGIANAIDTARTRQGLAESVVFWENVPGVLNTSDNAFGCFLAGLAGEEDPLVAPGGRWTNAGYVSGPQRNIAWRVLDAQYFGVAQRRRRVFVVASARRGFDPAAVLFEFDGLRRDTAPSREARQSATHDTAPCLTSSGRGVGRTGDTRGQDPVVAVPAVVGAMTACGATKNKHGFGWGQQEWENGYAVPTLAKCLTTGTGRRYDTDTDTDTVLPAVAHSLRGEGFDASEDGTGRGTPLVPVCHADTMPTMTAGGPAASSHNQTSGQMRDQYIVPVLQDGVRYAHYSHDFANDRTTDPAGINPALTARTTASGNLNVLAPVAFPANLSATQHASTENLSPALGAKNPTAVAFQERGRTDGRSLEVGGDVAYALTAPSGGGRAQERNVLTPAMQVRRLTPTECERLQGFPTVSEKVIIEACLDLQNQGVRAALKCLKWQNSAWLADASASTPHARTVAASSGIGPASHAPLAALHVQLLYGHSVQAVHSHGRLIWSASGAAASAKSPPPTLAADTVAELARQLHEVVRGTALGKAASPPPINLSFPVSSGAISAEKSGHATAASASDATSDLKSGTFTTSDLGQITTCSDSTAETLCCSVLRAIAGCIPRETLPASFSIELTVESPYTAIPWRKKPASECPDGPRYKALGNSWAVPNVRWIGQRINAQLEALYAEQFFARWGQSK